MQTRFFGAALILLIAASLTGCSSRTAQPTAPAQDEVAVGRAIANILREGCKAVERGDVDGMIAPFEHNERMRMFDFSIPRSKSYADLRRADAEFVAVLNGPAHCRYTEINTRLLGQDYAYSISMLDAGGRLKSGQVMNLTIRSTDLWKLIDGRWQIIHEHNSMPVDLATGRADTTSAP